MELDFSVLWENSNDEPTNAAERIETRTEPPQGFNPSNYTPSVQNAVESPLAALERNQLLEQAGKIVKDYRQKRAAAEGIMQQIEKDIGKQDPLLLLLFAAEALDRMSGGGDQYIKRLEARAAAAGIGIEPYKF